MSSLVGVIVCETENPSLRAALACEQGFLDGCYVIAQIFVVG